MAAEFAAYMLYRYSAGNQACSLAIYRQGTEKLYEIMQRETVQMHPEDKQGGSPFFGIATTGTDAKILDKKKIR